MDLSDNSLRTLLSRSGSYPTIASYVASGRLPHFPVSLFEHVGDVYHRVETAAADDFELIKELRLTALVHEEAQESLLRLLALGGVLDFLPTIVAVTGRFGSVWKLKTDDDFHTYVDANRSYLPAILLFELAHEGQSTPAMERAAKLSGHQRVFQCWAERLASATPPNSCLQRTALRAEPER